MEVDIAVDLAGISADARPDVFEYRPAPIQVNYLGFPGTSGADHMDYILADRHVIPTEHQQYYNEKVVYLPDCYLPTDASVKISDRTPTRAECGLPEAGFVFCSFSHDHKISPAIFDVWMRLLLQVPGSVMWLMSRNDQAVQNLRKEAQARGVSPDRLIFAGRVPLVEDHLARYRQADLFIDTFPYNAHTTAADALMAGLPVITCMGNAFASRVAGSLLHSLGLSELIAATLADYEALALDLASNSQRLDQVRSKLLENCGTFPLFDTGKFCRNFEEALRQMHSGQPAIDRFALSEEGNAPRVEPKQKSVASNGIAVTVVQPKQMAGEHKVAKKRCLHLGGLVRTAGWEVISDAPGAVVDHTGGVSDLSRFADDSFDVLHAHHVLEKLDYREQLLQTLVEWRRVLKPGGVLAVTVVDLELLAAKLIDKRLDLSDRFMAMRMMFGGHMDKSDYHQVGLTEEFLVSFLIEAGFAEARRVASFNHFEISLPSDSVTVPTDLNILTCKPGGVPERLGASGMIVSTEDVLVDASGQRVADLV
jgi:predicted SAM-dependent methyltransferase